MPLKDKRFSLFMPSLIVLKDELKDDPPPKTHKHTPSMLFYTRTKKLVSVHIALIRSFNLKTQVLCLDRGQLR